MEKTKRILGIAIRIAGFIAAAYVIGYLVGLATKALA